MGGGSRERNRCGGREYVWGRGICVGERNMCGGEEYVWGKGNMCGEGIMFRARGICEVEGEYAWGGG